MYKDFLKYKGEDMKTEKEIKERIKELREEIAKLELEANPDEDRNYITNKRAELFSLKWVLGE